MSTASPGGLRLAGLLFILTVLLCLPWVVDGMTAKWFGPSLGAGLAAYGMLRYGAKPDWIDALTCLGLAWAGASLLWSYDPALGSVQWLRACCLGLCFMGLRRLPLWRHLPTWTALACLGVMGLALVGLDPLGNENFTAEFLLIALPILLARKLTQPVAVLAGLYMFAALDSKLPYFAIGLWGAWAIIEIARERGKFALFTASALTMVIGGLLFIAFRHEPEFQNSVFYRLELWVSTVGMWAQAPWFGNGLGSFNYLYPLFLDAELSLMGPKDYSVIATADLVAGAAHNDFLQLGAELGLVGLVIAGAWLFVLLREPVTEFQKRCFASAGIAFALAYVGFPMQNAPTALLALAALAALRPTTERGPAILPGLMAVFVTVASTVAVSQQAMAQAHYTGTFQASQQKAFIAVLEAHQRFEPDFMARLRLFPALVAAEASGLAEVDRESAEAAYDIGRSASPFHPGLLLARVAYLARQDGACLRECQDIMGYLMRHASRVGEVVRLKNLFPDPI